MKPMLITDLDDVALVRALLEMHGEIKEGEPDGNQALKIVADNDLLPDPVLTLLEVETALTEGLWNTVNSENPDDGPDSMWADPLREVRLLIPADRMPKRGTKPGESY